MCKTSFNPQPLRRTAATLYLRSSLPVSPCFNPQPLRRTAATLTPDFRICFARTSLSLTTPRTCFMAKFVYPNLICGREPRTYAPNRMWFASDQQRLVEVNHFAHAEFFDAPSALIWQLVESNAVLFFVYNVQHPLLHCMKLLFVKGAFKYRILNSLTVRFTGFGDSTQPLLACCRFGFHIVSHYNPHGYLLFY